MQQDKQYFKIGRNEVRFVGISFFIIYSFFVDIVERKLGLYFLLMSMIVSMALILLSIMTGFGIRINGKVFLLQIGWVVMLLFMVLPRNKMLANGNYWKTLRWIWALFIAYGIAVSTEIYSKIIKLIAICGFINVASIFYFYINKSAYNVMYNFWNEWPAGTQNGKCGYRAGIAEHYSKNAIYTLMAACVFFVLFLLKCRENKNGRLVRNKYLGIIFILCAIGLVMTQKRAHTLFGAVAMIGGYYFCDITGRKSKSTRLLKIVMLVCLLAVGIEIAAVYSTQLSDLLERFATAGEDKSSVLRKSMRDMAFRLFRTSPITGIGWGAYGYEYKVVFKSTFTLDVHNVYVQMLCETGVVGFCIFIATFAYTLIIAIRCSKLKNLSLDEYIAILYALVVQIFVTLYNATGNCMYDITFCHYMVAVGMSHGVYYKYQMALKTYEVKEVSNQRAEEWEIEYLS
ncbi:MAG: O-antigen ligase family protein [Lachnospiraceae bacterium]|nr:O-antigen ligase family protein [Lachnospiraceae bacterium]